jgi:hypothetical protein
MPSPRKKPSHTEAEDRWVSSYEASRIARVSRLALYERALSGEVATTKVAGRRVFAREDVERIAAPAVA